MASKGRKKCNKNKHTVEETEDETVENAEEPHAYIYIKDKLKRAGEGERKIVPTSAIKKFDFDKYVDDPKSFKDTVFKLKKNAGETNTTFCYVLHASETYSLLKDYIKNKKGRFHIPKGNTSQYLDSSVEEPSLQNNIEVQEARKSIKQTKSIRKQAAAEEANRIISEYVSQNPQRVASESQVNELCDIENNQNDLLDDFTQPPKNRPALNNVTNVPLASNNEIVHDKGIEGYKLQTEYFRDRYAEVIAENRKLKAMIDKSQLQGQENQITNSNSQTALGSEKVRKSVYDNVFEISNAPTYVIDPAEAENISEPAKDIVVLRKGVKCNATAYKDAYKTRKCQTFFTIINTGIYGTEELAKQCASRKRSADSDVRLLSPVKKSVVEDEFYKFLVAKGFTSAQIDLEMEKCATCVVEDEFYKFLVAKGFTSAQIDLEMEKCATYQHNSITAARKRLARNKKANDDNERINHAISALRRQEFNDPQSSFLSHYRPIRQSTGIDNLLHNNDTNNNTLDEHEIPNEVVTVNNNIANNINSNNNVNNTIAEDAQ